MRGALMVAAAAAVTTAAAAVIFAGKFVYRLHTFLLTQTKTIEANGKKDMRIQWISARCTHI